MFKRKRPAPPLPEQKRKPTPAETAAELARIRAATRPTTSEERQAYYEDAVDNERRFRREEPADQLEHSFGDFEEPPHGGER